MSNIQQLIRKHSELLESNPYTYFELSYTKYTGWMAWVCSNAREKDPDRKVIACGQGSSPEESCADALRQLASAGGEKE